jgi:hypothetical protein
MKKYHYHRLREIQPRHDKFGIKKNELKMSVIRYKIRFCFLLQLRKQS